MQFRDYYEVLGIDRDASQDQIRKAFRKLARKFHPDVAEDKDEGERRFKEINEAYEVLSDPEKRRKYDALGAQWEHMGDFTPPPGGQGPAAAHEFPGGDGDYEFHFEGTGFSDFFENLFGGRATGRGFHGFGAAPDGRGKALRGADIEADLLVKLEETMTGSERSLKLQLASAAGGPPESRSVRIRIPKGISEGQLIRVAGHGQPGLNGGEAGDLFLRVRLERHPDYRVQDSHLYHELRLAPWEAVLGTTVPVRTLHGTVKIRIPPGTEPGTELRIRGRGLPRGTGDGFGDLFAVVTIAVPSKVSDDETRLWNELAAKSEFDPRK